MEYAGILQLLAELASGVLGFSGVVAVLGRRSAGPLGCHDRRLHHHQIVSPVRPAEWKGNGRISAKR
jgi:hypothetical protein